MSIFTYTTIGQGMYCYIRIYGGRCRYIKYMAVRRGMWISKHHCFFWGRESIVSRKGVAHSAEHGAVGTIPRARTPTREEKENCPKANATLICHDSHFLGSPFSTLFSCSLLQGLQGLGESSSFLPWKFTSTAVRNMGPSGARVRGVNGY